MFDKARFVVFGVVAVLIVAATNVTFAFSAGGHDAQQNTTNIVMGNITGTYGGEGGVSQSQGSGLPAWVQGDYGFHCSGNTCATQTQDLGTQDNILKITVTWNDGDATTRHVTGQTQLKDKKQKQLTTDQDCPPGPYSPAFDAGCLISLSGAAAGSGGGSGSGGGGFNKSFSHSSPTRSFYYGPGSPPPEADPAFDDQTQNPQTSVEWNINPQDPGTQTKTMSAKARVTFSGTASEIVVGDTYLKATAKLTVSVTQ